MQEVANAGRGLAPIQADPADNAEYFTAQNPAELNASLQTIIDNVLSCSFTLENRSALPTVGEICMDGDKLPASGWRLRDEFTVELQGSYCYTLRAGDDHFISARFTSCDGGG